MTTGQPDHAGAAMTDGRYGRHEHIPGWRQHLLATASVIVVGVGALGNEVARLLAMAGVGRLLLCDPDVVAESNLSRCVLFRQRDIGRAKVEAAQAALHDLAPATQVDIVTATHLSGVGLAAIRDMDLVISCLDSLQARIQLAARCNATEVGLLDAGTHPWGGEVCYYPPSAGCVACGLSERQRAVRDDPWSCATADHAVPQGASAPVSALIGAWEATLAIRVLLGLTVPAAAVYVDTGARTIHLERSRDPACPLHAPINWAKVEPVSPARTVADVMARLAPDEEAFAWAALPGTTTLLLSRAPYTAPLVELGIAAQEILPVARRGHPGTVRYLELKGPTA
ncbi:ThiF family adenylyltransferase [Streptosporangium sp. LJ11]|uniref:HesA/MoeB/ThiF family protein n=1 Tax=Streptosporangium sp. LJ11 TaxID=3436927 RepID=UPI003F78B228